MLLQTSSRELKIVCRDELAEPAGDVVLEAADDLFLGHAFLGVRRQPVRVAGRPLRVQAGHSRLVEPADDLPDRVLVGLHEAGDSRRQFPAGRGEHDHGPSQSDRSAGSPAIDSQQLLTFLITQPPHACRICHHHSLTTAWPTG